MSIATLLASNASLAISLIKQFVASPMVGGIAIQATRFDCTTEAEVSRHVLIRSSDSELQNITDSVAPGPRTWEIEGYIGGLPMELTSLYMPSLTLMTDLLQGILDSRKPTVLLDPYYRTINNVLISRFNYSKAPEEQNKVPVKISLVEITVLTVQSGPQSEIGQKGVVQPSDGGSYGAPANLGSTANSNVGTSFFIGGVASALAVGVSIQP
jgi:hypothetical protein